MPGMESGVVGEAPAMRGIGAGGLPMKKKLSPKAEPKKLKENKSWKKSFNVFKSSSGKRGS